MQLQSEESEIDSMRKYVNIVITKTRGQNVKYHYRGVAKDYLPCLARERETLKKMGLGVQGKLGFILYVT